MNQDIILKELLRLTDTEQIEIGNLLPEAGFESTYAPINTYLRELEIGTKPETASEGLFRNLAKDVLKISIIPQVYVGTGFVDFKLDAVEDSSIVIELKPLFNRYDEERLKRDTLAPTKHSPQIQNYLQRSEYVILTDLRDAYLYSARDAWQLLQPFAKISFAELLAGGSEIGSLHDLLRRAEDNQPKPDLDRSFFEHLKEWFAAFQAVRFKKEEEHDELVILLINKIIFAKTMEDHSLVKYRQLQEDWERAKERWMAKGPRRIVQQFLYDFEQFFDDYYDTELFERPVWGDLEPTDKNYERFAGLVEGILGLDNWNQTFQRGIVHYNYRLINEDIFGKSYEMFLAANRKDEGIYYTPAGITTPMADSLVDSLFSGLTELIGGFVSKEKCDFANADQAMRQLAEITIADTAAGSGGFLIKVLRGIWRHYQKIDEAVAWVKKIKGADLLDLPPNVQQAADFRNQWNFDNRRVLVAQILVRHIFAVDKDGGAIEVAKTNLWKEAVKLSKEDYNFRKLVGDIRKTLPSLRLNFICNDSLVDTNLDEQVTYLHEVCGHTVQKICALRETYIQNPSEHAPLEEALKLQEKLRENLAEHFQTVILPAPALFAALSFFPAWFDADGKPRPMEKRGFDGVIGNPPWEAVKPIKKEFAKVGKYSTDAGEFDKWFNKKLKDEPEFAKRWKEHQIWYEEYKSYLGRHFHKQGTGDWNLWKLFIENNLGLVRSGGGLSLLVPSGIQTDEGCSNLRRWLTTENTFHELTSFENRGYTEKISGKEETRHIFPDVDNRFKFGFFKVVKGVLPKKGHTFDARFYLHNPEEVSSTPIKYSVDMVQRFSPLTNSIMEFRSQADYLLCGKIRDEHQVIHSLGYQFRRELHPADDVGFYLKESSRKLELGELPIYEGKMIHQFDDKFIPRSFHGIEKVVRPALLSKEIYRLGQFVRESKTKLLEGEKLPDKKTDFENLLNDIFKKKKFKLHYEQERIAYRRVGSSTNERTIIATLLQPNVFLSDTLSYLTPCNYILSGKDGRLEQERLPKEVTRSILSLLNSFVLNYYIRQKISATVNMFYVYELPIPKLSAAQKKKLAALAEKLLKTSSDVATRAELEVLIARELYGLSLEDWQHLTGTFTYGGDSTTKAELDEIIRLSLKLFPK